MAVLVNTVGVVTGEERGFLAVSGQKRARAQRVVIQMNPSSSSSELAYFLVVVRVPNRSTVEEGRWILLYRYRHRLSFEDDEVGGSVVTSMWQRVPYGGAAGKAQTTQGRFSLHRPFPRYCSLPGLPYISKVP